MLSGDHWGVDVGGNSYGASDFSLSDHSTWDHDSGLGAFSSGLD